MLNTESWLIRNCIFIDFRNCTLSNHFANKTQKKFNNILPLISELSSGICLIKIGRNTATVRMDFGAFIRWCGLFPVAIFWFKWWWLSCTVQFTRPKWTIYDWIRWSNHLFNGIFQSCSTRKWRGKKWAYYHYLTRFVEINAIKSATYSVIHFATII